MTNNFVSIEVDKRENGLTKTDVAIYPSTSGAITGMAAGAAIGGPVGAIVGGVVGWVLGPPDQVSSTQKNR